MKVETLRSALAGLRDSVRAVFARFLDDDCPMTAASIAYYTLLSIFPFLLVVATIATQFLQQERVQAAIQEGLRTYVPFRSRAIILDSMQEAVRLRGPVGLTAIVAFLWSSSAAIGAVRHSLNRIWDVERRRPFWRRKLLEVVTTLVVGGILGGLVAMSVGLSILSELGWQIPLVQLLGSVPLAALWQEFGIAVLMFATFLVIYRVLPNHRLRWQWLWPGALVAAILLAGARHVAFWGLARFAQYQLIYGSIAGIVIFVLWMYVVATILLIGAEVSRYVSAIGRTGRL